MEKTVQHNSQLKKIAVLTSGGDAPGMNAAIRAVVRYACAHKIEVLGSERGFQGLIDNQFLPMNMRSVSDTIHRGGTILKTARCPDFITPEGQDKAIANIKNQGIDGIVVIGGDGSFAGAQVLSRRGIPTVGIPGTIDNDLAYTDYTLGFDTACNTVLDAINKIRDTMNSHERVSIIEVMGRHCGDLALYAGVCGGAEVIVVPEIKLDTDDIIACLIGNAKNGKKSGIVVLAEGAGRAGELSREMTAKCSLAVKSTVLGYIQRGGNPSMVDRLMGTRCGVKAVQLLIAGEGAKVVGIKNNEIISMGIEKALAMKKEFNYELYEIAKVIAQ